jgi:hypothetical protein
MYISFFHWHDFFLGLGLLCLKPFSTIFQLYNVSWWSVLLVEETGEPGENHRPVASHWQTISHSVVSSTPHLSGFKLTTSVVIGTDCIGSCKSNYHSITTKMVPTFYKEKIYFYLQTLCVLNICQIYISLKSDHLLCVSFWNKYYCRILILLFIWYTYLISTVLICTWCIYMYL